MCCIMSYAEQESWIMNQEIFIFNTTKTSGQVNSTCLQEKKPYSIFQVSKQYVTIIRSRKTKQNKINLIGSCINRRNTQQNYVNSVMTNGNKPVMRHINAPVHNINTVRLTWVKSEKKTPGWHLSESSTNKKLWNWICIPLEFYSYGYGSMSIDSIVQEPICR